MLAPKKENIKKSGNKAEIVITLLRSPHDEDQQKYKISISDVRKKTSVSDAVLKCRLNIWRKVYVERKKGHKKTQDRAKSTMVKLKKKGAAKISP